MTRNELEALLREKTTEFTLGEAELADAWSFIAHEAAMQAFASDAKDRMRIMGQVASMADVTEAQIERVLVSNFNGDARYGVHDGSLWAIFVHSLSGLRVSELSDGLRQVASLMTTFGDKFTAGPLRFEWPRPPLDTGGVRRRTEETVTEANIRSRGRVTDCDW